MAWYVLRVKTRNEYKISLALEQLGVSVYCPMVTEIRQWSDRKKKVTIPVFNSYVFVNIDEKERKKVFQVSGVLSYLFWLNKPAIVRDDEIAMLKMYLNENTRQIPNKGIKLGDKVFISDGYFKGLEGIVKEVNKNRLQILLSELGFKITLGSHNVV
jgi:transcription antitermination factor NusG